MSDVRKTVLNNDDATYTPRVSKAERRLDRLTWEAGEAPGTAGLMLGTCTRSFSASPGFH